MEAQVALGIPIYVVGVHAMATLLLRHLDAFSHDVSDSEKENSTRFIQNQLFKVHVVLNNRICKRVQCTWYRNYSECILNFCNYALWL